MDDTLTIGQLAKRFGLNTSAIRYYEANGVLPGPARVSVQRGAPMAPQPRTT
jgi:DNA-binding transcriptional MerR regulator